MEKGSPGSEKSLSPGENSAKAGGGLPLSTGSCAAAAAQAAARWLRDGTAPTTVSLALPRGEKVPVPVEPLSNQNHCACCQVIKPRNRDADVTAGTRVQAQVCWQKAQGVKITGGPGVGRVTLPGLQIPPGEPAINPAPRKLIAENVRPYLPAGYGAQIEVSLPEGEDLALRTMNQRLGIEGGLSVLGTTGLVQPMSWEAYTESLLPQIDVALARGYRRLTLVPGRLGQKWAMELGLPPAAIVQTSNFVGPMLDAAAQRGARAILLAAHVGKLAKVAAGSFFTHNRTADGRLEVLAALAGKLGAPSQLVTSVLEAPTAETAAQLLCQQGYDDLFSLLAERAARRCREYVDEQLETEAVVFDLQGKVLGRCPRSSHWGR